MQVFPIGKIPPEILAKIIAKAPILDERVVIGPNIGLDCAVIENGENFLVIKTDPITFVTHNPGWYAVQINVNDIVTTGAIPKWMMATILLPENKTTIDLVENISKQLFTACNEKGISFIGGHTEITYGIDRPIISATIVGEVNKEKLITPSGVQIGDYILLTKGIGIEGIAIIANEFGEKLTEILSPSDIQKAKDFVFSPGISIFNDARLATGHQGIHAMHDVTEGGLAAALWELAIASNTNIQFFPENVILPKLTKKICEFFKINPINLISSGALIISIDPKSLPDLINDLNKNGIQCSKIGVVISSGVNVWSESDNLVTNLKYPERDEITKLF